MSNEHTIFDGLKLDECDRQITAMALAHLAVERPGWNDALRRIAEQLQAGPDFEEFKRFRQASADTPATAEAKAREARRIGDLFRRPAGSTQ